MELIEGVPLAEHFNSLKEKQQQFTEDRIWNIFMQVKKFEPLGSKSLVKLLVLTHLNFDYPLKIICISFC